MSSCYHDDGIKWKHFLCYWPFVWGIHRSPVNSPHKGQWRGTLMFSLICAWTKGWVNNREATYWFKTPSRSLWRHCNGWHDVIVLLFHVQEGDDCYPLTFARVWDSAFHVYGRLHILGCAIGTVGLRHAPTMWACCVLWEIVEVSFLINLLVYSFPFLF